MRRTRLTVFLGLLATAACQDSTGPGPAAEGPDTLLLTVPDMVEEGQPFSLTVTAPAGPGSAPDPAFSGTVTLTSSAGSISPGTLSLTEGTVTAGVTLGGQAGEVTVTVRSGTTTASARTTVLGHGAIARIDVEPGAVLLPSAGSSQALAVRAYDASDLPTVPEGVSWTSSDPSVVTISDAGVAAAVSSAGSAQITAAANGVVSAPVLALVAQPAGGATLVADAQIIGGPEPVNANAAYGLGWQYRVRLAATALPDVGAIVLGTGEAPVGGRVVAATQAGDTAIVTLEVVSPAEMFDELVVNASLDLSEAELIVPDEVDQAFSVQRVRGGAIEFTRRASGSLRASGMHSSLRYGTGVHASDLDFNLGPFKCKIEATVAPLQLTGNATFTVTPDLTFDLAYDSNAGGLQRLALRGEVEATVKVEPKLETSFESKVDCNVKLAQIALPIGGPLALIFGGQVPLGVGFEMNGKTTVANAGVRFEVGAEASAEIGIDCTGPCQMINTLDSTGEGSFEPVLPDPSEQFKVELRIFPYGFAKLSIGNPLLNALQFESFEIRAGLAQLLDLAPASVQIDNPDYASNFRLSLFGQGKAGAKIDDLIAMLNISLAKVEARVEVPLAESPSGTLTISPASVRSGSDEELGDMAEFTVTLDPVRYSGFDAVESVELRWRRSDGNGGYTLENGRPGCTSMSAAPGQTTFTCRSDFLEDHEGVQTFYALVHARLFGQPLPVPLEIGSNGSASVVVTGTTVAITIDPLADTLFTGQSRQFSATVTGTDDTGVIWTASGGTIAADGVYTAGAAPGLFEVTARSAADTLVTASAMILVKEAPQATPTQLSGAACNTVVDSVDDLPFSISGSSTHPDFPAVICNATAALAVTTHADGTIVMEGTVSASSEHTPEGARWSLNFVLSGEYEYEFTGEANGEGRVSVALWQGGGTDPTGGTPILACATGPQSGFSGVECPEMESTTGVLQADAGLGYTIGARANYHTDASLRLVLRPVP